MQAVINVDAPNDLIGCDPDDIYLNMGLAFTQPVVKNMPPQGEIIYGKITTTISLCSDINWAEVISAIESGENKSFGGGFGSTGGIGILNGTVTITSPDGGGTGSVITVEAPEMVCLDTFRTLRDAAAEFAADPIEFARKHRDADS